MLPAGSSVSQDIFRIAPPLTVSDSELDRGLEILDAALLSRALSHPARHVVAERVAMTRRYGCLRRDRVRRSIGPMRSMRSLIVICAR